KDEVSQLVVDYDIPQNVRVLLPKRSQTIYDAPLGFFGLYTHHFTLSNLRVPIPQFICEVLNYFKVHISQFNHFGMVKLATFAVMCKAYGGEPSVDLLRAFLNLGPAGLKTSRKRSPIKPISYHRGREMDFRSFMMDGVDGEFNFLPKGGLDEEGNSPSTRPLNNETSAIDA
ncbi:hypothetical protein Tco_1208995, partial [Tanacetum coccineum]